MTYSTVGSTFDGTNDWLEKVAIFTGEVASRQVLISFWLRLNGGDAANQIILEQQLDTGGFLPVQILRLTTNKVRLLMQSAAGAVTFDFSTSASHIAGQGWKHFLFSADTNFGAGAKLHGLYVNDAADAGTVTDAGVAFDIVLGSPSHIGVGGRGNGGATKMTADIADLYMAFGTYLDLSVTANRRLFIDASGKPVDLGATGSTPLGAQPIMFLKGTANAFNVNSGSGGNFTLHGTLTTPANVAPVITSNGGGATASVAMLAGGTTTVTTVTATDADLADALTYSISGGADQALFSVGAVTGVLTFVNPPVSGTYVVIVQVSDGALTDTQTITVTVTGASRSGGGALSVAQVLTAKKKSRGPEWPDWLR